MVFNKTPKRYIIPAKFYNGKFNELRLINKSEWNEQVMNEMRQHQLITDHKI